MPNNLNQFFLGVDGGGTKTTVYLCDEQEKILAQATNGPMSLAVVSEDEAITNLSQTITQVLTSHPVESISAAVIGLAGVDTAAEIEHATQLFHQTISRIIKFDHFQLVNDTAIALRSGTDAANAICLIAGTGSNCVGHNAAGQTAKAGGMDYLLSDEGSGYEIGAKVLKAAVKSFDGRGQKTIMEQLVAEHFGIASIAELKDKVYHPALTKTQIAEVSRICFIAQAQHDTQANEIFMAAIEEMRLMIYTVMKKLDLQSQPTEVVLIGGIARDPVVVQQLQLRVATQQPNLQLIVPELPPVMGAIRLAKQL